MDSESSSGGVSDAELFDMLFGMAPKNNSSNHSNSNNNLRNQLMTETEAPLSPCYNSSISEPGYGLIERCWEPGEIVDQDFEMSSSLSTSSSPVRGSYQHRYRRDRVSKVLFLTLGITTPFCLSARLPRRKESGYPVFQGFSLTSWGWHL